MRAAPRTDDSSTSAGLNRATRSSAPSSPPPRKKISGFRSKCRPVSSAMRISAWPPARKPPTATATHCTQIASRAPTRPATAASSKSAQSAST